MRTGLLTQHAQHFMSLISNAKTIQNTIPNWSLIESTSKSCQSHLEALLDRKFSPTHWKSLVNYSLEMLNYKRQVKNVSSHDSEIGPNRPDPPDVPAEHSWLKDAEGNTLLLVQAIEGRERDRVLTDMINDDLLKFTDAPINMVTHQGGDHV